MRKPIEEKTPLAAWATLSREGAGMSVEEAVAALLARGHSVTAATIRGIEGGSKGASVRLRRLLSEVYGVNPLGQKETGPSGTGETGLAQAITALTAELEKWRLERESIAIRLQTLEAAVALLARPSGEGLSALGPPPVEAGSGR